MLFSSSYFPYLLPFDYIAVFMFFVHKLYIQILKRIENDILVHHNPSFNLFILHNSFDNQGREINENDGFIRFDILSFTPTF